VWRRQQKRRWIGKRVGFFLSSRGRIHGIQVRHLIAEREPRNECLKRIEAALDLIRRYQPYRYARIRRDVRRIWIWGAFGAAGRWIDEMRMCQLSEDYVLSAETSVEDVAATIIHEATHARLCRANIAYEESMRGRVERLCARAEIQFAQLLPDGERVIEWAERCRQWDTAEWSNLALARRRAKALEGVIDELGWRGWIASFLRGVIRRRLERLEAGTARAKGTG